MKETCLETEEIFKGKVFTVKRDKVELEDGSTSMREIVLHNGGSSVVAVTDDGNILLVRQYRYAYGEELYEIPAGKIEIGEDAKVCAERELLEETGYRAGKIEHLTTIYPTPGYTSEKIRIYKATDLTFEAQHLDPGEFLEVCSVSIDRAKAMIDDGTIVDGKTIIGILLATK